MTGRVAIVTGASSGLGFHVAKTLADSGSEVILGGADDEQIKAAVEKIKQLKPEAVVSSIQLDLSSIESVRKFVSEFHATGKNLNALVTCDAIKLSNSTRYRRYSSENFELTMATNHLGHFLLTNLLLQDLKNSVANGGEGRVVVVTSSFHDPKSSKQCKTLQPIDLENLFLFNEKTYSSPQAYKNSRAANLAFAYALARQTQESGVKVNAICPGVEPVEDAAANGMQKKFAQVFMPCITAPAPSFDRSAIEVCSLVTEEKYKDVTGKYIKDGAEVQSSEETLNEELQNKLWELSARYVQLDNYEPLVVVRPPAEDEQTKKKEAKTKKKGKKEEQAENNENGEAKAPDAVAAGDEQADAEVAEKNGLNGHDGNTDVEAVSNGHTQNGTHGEENGKEVTNGETNGTEHTTNGSVVSNGKVEPIIVEKQLELATEENAEKVVEQPESQPEVTNQVEAVVDNEEPADR